MKRRPAMGAGPARPRTRALACTLAVTAAFGNGPVRAQAVEPASPAAESASSDAESAPELPVPRWEGALGFIGSYGPEYSGSDRYGFGVRPGFYVRYGRWTVTNASGFITRRADDIARGLGFDVVESDAVRLNAALRIDGGRNDDTSSDLAGMGDIEPTVRLRITGNWRFDPRWRVGSSWTIDAFGRGGGQLADVSLVREHRPSPAAIWTLGAAVSMASGRYMQTYYGVSPEQSANSGYAAYSAGGGFRDASVSGSWRQEFGEHWVMLGNASVNRLLGSASGSPIVKRVGGWSASFGAAYRY